MRGPRRAFIVIVLVAAACKFSSPLDDDEGFLGPSPSIDGSVPSFDATVAEEDADAGVEANIAVDATIDATPDAGADAARPCDASFCDDFDDGPLGATWTRIQASPEAGTIGLVADAGRSAPYAMGVTTFGGALEYRNVELAKLLGGVKTASCSFAVKPVERPGRPAVFFFRGLTESLETWQAWIALASTETTLGLVVFSKDGGPPFQSVASAPVAPAGDWTELSIAIDFAKVTLTVGGGPSAALSIPFALGDAGVSAHVGIQVFETTQEAVLFDDVRCTAVY